MTKGLYKLTSSRNECAERLHGRSGLAFLWLFQDHDTFLARFLGKTFYIIRRCCGASRVDGLDEDLHRLQGSSFGVWIRGLENLKLQSVP